MNFIKIPKTHLHIHLEGAVRVATAREFYNRRPWTHKHLDLDIFKTKLQMGDMENDFSNFLSKFDFVFSRDTTIYDLQRVASEAVEDQAADGVRYLELRFCPHSFEQRTGISPAESLKAVIEGLKDTRSRDNSCIVSLIAIIDQRLGNEKAVDLLECVLENPEIRTNVCAFDIASDPKKIPLETYADVCRRIHDSGFGLTVHAGELMGADTVRTAVEVLAADRIGHGIRAIEDDSVLALLKERQIPLEICLMSNYYTRAVSGLAYHPFKRFLDAGVKVTLNTDDPMVFGKKLSEEYALAKMMWGLSEEDFYKINCNGIDCAFIGNDTKNKLRLEFDRI